MLAWYTYISYKYKKKKHENCLNSSDLFSHNFQMKVFNFVVKIRMTNGDFVTNCTTKLKG